MVRPSVAAAAAAAGVSDADNGSNVDDCDRRVTRTTKAKMSAGCVRSLTDERRPSTVEIRQTPLL